MYLVTFHFSTVCWVKSPLCDLRGETIILRLPTAQPPHRRSLPFISHLTAALYLPQLSFYSPLPPPVLLLNWPSSKMHWIPMFPAALSLTFNPLMRLPGSHRPRWAEPTVCQVADYNPTSNTTPHPRPLSPISWFGPTQFPAGATDGALPGDEGEESWRWETHVEENSAGSGRELQHVGAHTKCSDCSSIIKNISLQMDSSRICFGVFPLPAAWEADLMQITSFDLTRHEWKHVFDFRSSWFHCSRVINWLTDGSVSQSAEEHVVITTCWTVL